MIRPSGAWRRTVIAFVGAIVSSVPLLPSQSLHATSVVAFDDRGQLGGGIFVRTNLLGAPDGNVCSLGNGGYVTLGFAVTIVDGPGADFLVTENSFFSGPPGYAFVEAAFVEVSSNGVDFARFPSTYSGPQAPQGPFGVETVAAYHNLAGIGPGRFGAAWDPRDVVGAGGDAFDLADLASDPLVVAGKVKLQQITQVRFVDAIAGVAKDARGVPIYDPGAGSADLDGVTVLHHAGNQAPVAPRVDLAIPRDGDLVLTLAHPAGLAALDPASLGISLYGTPLANPFDLLGALVVTNVSPTAVTFRLGTTLPAGFLVRMAVAISDGGGRRSGASAVRAP